jgi:hypothetical protein
MCGATRRSGKYAGATLIQSLLDRYSSASKIAGETEEPRAGFFDLDRHRAPKLFSKFGELGEPDPLVPG